VSRVRRPPLAKPSRARPSLAEQGRQLTALRQRIEAIRDDADLRAHAAPAQAQRIRAGAEAEVTPLIAEGAALRDAIVQRARQRAKRAWSAAYAGIALALVLLAWLLLAR
jgi:hypothetical protein